MKLTKRLKTMLKYFINQLRFLLIPGMKNLITQLKDHEGEVKRRDRHMPYFCSANKETIGFGRNLDDNGIRDDEAMYLLINDISSSRRELLYRYPWAENINGARQCAFINMIFNMGIYSFSGFKKMIYYAKDGDWYRAGEEAKDSKWYRDDVAKSRSKQIIKQIQTGLW